MVELRKIKHGLTPPSESEPGKKAYYSHNLPQFTKTVKTAVALAETS
jgi:hypothetical protein